jgi:hypothetical protein
MKRILLATIAAVMVLCEPALATQTYSISVPVHATHIWTSPAKMGVYCAISPTQTFPMSQTAAYTGNYADFTLDSTGSYNANVTVTITVPAAFSVGSYQCTIGQDPQGTGNFTISPWVPQSFINGVTGSLPHWKSSYPLACCGPPVNAVNAVVRL